MNGKKILYISYKPHLTGAAISTNTQRRINAMEQAGYHVIEFIHNPHRVIKDFYRMILLLSDIDCINIRIDGSCILDKFTLLKLFRWSIKIIWEVHGFPEENHPARLTFRDTLVSTKSLIKRRLLSYLVDRFIYISPELKQYARNKFANRSSTIISNFIAAEEGVNSGGKSITTMERYLSQTNYFKVVWTGNPTLAWQATDVIEKTAQYIYKIDPSIIFILVGYPDSGRPMQWFKNIIVLGRLPRDATMQIISLSDVCIALYHTPAWVPFYFIPLKVLDYMKLKKPIVATKLATIQSLILHGHNGLLTRNNAREVAGNILLVKKNRRLATRLGRNAYNTIVSAHTVTQAAVLYQNLFSTI